MTVQISNSQDWEKLLKDALTEMVNRKFQLQNATITKLERERDGKGSYFIGESQVPESFPYEVDEANFIYWDLYIWMAKLWKNN
jgi:hypothetical protein